jgi:hypothetical protein
MSRGDRLGIAGLILGLIGIAIAILWPTVKWVGWGAVAVAIGLGICWAILEFKRPIEVPSLVFAFGAPLGNNDSPVWIMMLKHYGPNPAYNCNIDFYDQDRKNIEHEWLVKHPHSPYPPPGLAGQSQTHLHVDEAGPVGSIGNFQWRPVDPNRQHYSVSISCRDGVFVETWQVTRVNGVLRSKITIEHGAEWVRKHPKSSRVIFECTDSEFSDAPLATALDSANRAPHPGWKPNHKFEFPVAIIDPNGNVQVASGIKSPDGRLKTDFGCWNLLTRHFGDSTT